jgi:trans-aconitate 2-methyltransferase
MRRSLTTKSTWDAQAYHEVATIQTEWGKKLLEGQDLRGDEQVLDIGSGTGIIAAWLLERHPRLRLVTMDIERAMVQTTRQTLDSDHRTPHTVQADVLALPFSAGFDLVFSNAVLHWVSDHARAFKEIHRVLAPGGRLLAAFGGEGNLHDVHKTARAVLAERPFVEQAALVLGRWNHQDAQSTITRLQDARFQEINVRLEPLDARFEDDETWRAFLRTVTLRAFLHSLPVSLHEAYLDRYMERAGEAGLERRLDYKRIYVDARRVNKA